MKDKVQIERVDNFGDTRKITYNVERRQFEGVGRISSTDVARLKADGNFMADTYSYITAGDAILLHIDR